MSSVTSEEKELLAGNNVMIKAAKSEGDDFCIGHSGSREKMTPHIPLFPIHQNRPMWHRLPNPMVRSSKIAYQSYDVDRSKEIYGVLLSYADLRRLNKLHCSSRVGDKLATWLELTYGVWTELEYATEIHGGVLLTEYPIANLNSIHIEIDTDKLMQSDRIDRMRIQHD